MAFKIDPMTHNSQKIILNQALHGYSDGHRLLASSSAFSSDIDRLLFVMSDMSGPSMIKGFERYLTGYPLQNDESYALAMTWYAPEKKRPGCVYTHTIIIKNHDLPYIKNLICLIDQFKRPYSDNDILSYKEPIIFDNCENLQNNIMSNNVISSLPHVIKSLYTESDKPVYIFNDKPETWERIFLSIWSQQWPKLMRKFTFCTGALTSRKLSGTHLDLQLVPTSYVTQIKRDVPECSLIDVNNTNNITSHEEWVNLATRDICEPIDNYRDFLKMYGIESVDGRRIFSVLTSTYLFTQNPSKQDPEILLEQIYKELPSVNAAKSFKKAIFGKCGLLSNMFNGDELLFKLVLSRFNKCLPSKLLEIKSWSESVYYLTPNKSIGITISLLKHNMNTFQNEFVKGVFSSINEADAILFSTEFKGILPTLLSYNPKLLSSSLIWTLPEISKTGILDEANTNGMLSVDVLHAIISSGNSDELAAKLVQFFGDKAICAALDSQNVIDAFIGSNWIDQFCNNRYIVLDWYASCENPNTLMYAILANVFVISNDHYEWNNLTWWLRLAEHIKEVNEQSLYNNALSYLVKRAFYSTEDTAAEILYYVFQPLYIIAAQDKIEYNAWQYINVCLPYNNLREWDRCDKLRRALVHKYIECNWPIHLFLPTIKSDDETLARVIDYCTTSKSGRRFIKKIKLSAKNDSTNATRSQVRIINEPVMSLKLWLGV